jgi:alginate O-acetyltransferase complex protein AlgI
VITFGLVSFAWIFFKANSLPDAVLLIKNILQWNWNVIWSGELFKLGLDYKEFYVAVIAVILLLILEIFSELKNLIVVFSRQNMIFRWTIYLAAVLVILIFG